MTIREQKIIETLRELAKKLPKFPDGRIDYSNSDTALVITVFIKNKDKILLLKRSSKVSTYQGKWNTVAGYIDEPKPIREKITKLCQDKRINVIRYNGVSTNPTTDMVNVGTEIAKQNDVDVILGVGGGSAIDVAKAISVGVTHDGEAWEYRVIDGKPIEDKLLPIIAVTTTAGTGTEVTPVSVITNPAIPVKYAIADKLLCPNVAIIDPELTIALPAHITAATGWDAFCHSFESYTSPKPMVPA